MHEAGLAALYSTRVWHTACNDQLSPDLGKRLFRTVNHSMGKIKVCVEKVKGHHDRSVVWSLGFFWLDPRSNHVQVFCRLYL